MWILQPLRIISLILSQVSQVGPVKVKISEGHLLAIIKQNMFTV